MISETPLVEEGFWPAQIGNKACEGQLGALHNLLAAPYQGGIAWWVQDDQFNWIRHWTRACRVHPDAGKVAVEVPGDVLQQQLARVDVAQVLLVTLALWQLLQQIL